MGKGVYVKPKPIGAGANNGKGVETTDVWINKGYDFVPLYVGGMLKVSPDSTGMDATTPISKPTGTVAAPKDKVIEASGARP